MIGGITLKFRREARNDQKDQPELDVLARYLRRARLPAELALLERARTDRRALFELEAALQRQRKHLPISPDVKEMEQVLRTLFGPNPDLVLRNLKVGPSSHPVLAVALNGMIDRTTAQKVLSDIIAAAAAAPATGEAMVDWLVQQSSSVPITNVEEKFHSALKAILDGDYILFVAGSARVVKMEAPGWESRPISEPAVESVIRGPREGFVEAFATNASMVRRRLRDSGLRIETLIVGERSGTKVGLCYLNGLCKQELVDEAKRRLGRIQIDGVMAAGYIEELIEDTAWTIFPLMTTTERPDVVAAALLEGRFALLVDGTPFATIAPTTFTELMQASEDYYERFPVAFFVRLLRWFFASLVVLLPSLYVAITTYHQEVIPPALLLTLMTAREGVPFPAVIEALIMELSFEALREASVRMPKTMGQAISIAGALVLGQAAVQAGIVSAPMVIVVAITGIASFLVPKPNLGAALRLLRFPMLLLASTLGLYGLTVGIMATGVHLISLRSFGAPYFAPFGPWVSAGFQDALWRKPWWALHRRAPAIEAPDPVRQSERRTPGPTSQEGR